MRKLKIEEENGSSRSVIRWGWVDFKEKIEIDWNAYYSSDGEYVNPKKKQVKIPVLEQGFRLENGDIKFIWRY